MGAGYHGKSPTFAQKAVVLPSRPLRIAVLQCAPSLTWVVGSLRVLGFYWGVLGVMLLIGSAVYRLLPQVLGLLSAALQWPHWLLLVLFVPYMAYAEGYKGFHLNFSPRVVARAAWLRRQPPPLLVLFAPLFCMGFIYAAPRRRLISLGVTAGIVLLVALVRQLDQPLRGVIDAGVVVGLALGVVSLAYHTWQAINGKVPAIALDLP
jgi:hypothetical protein